MTNVINQAGEPAAKPIDATMAIGVVAAAVPSPVELKSADDFSMTLERLSNAIEGAGMTIFARIDHQAVATKAGLAMPPATVLIYGSPKGGTPLLLAAPAIALDLPLRVLVREDADGQVLVSYHTAVALVQSAGLSDEYAANLTKAESLIGKTIKP